MRPLAALLVCALPARAEPPAAAPRPTLEAPLRVLVARCPRDDGSLESVRPRAWVDEHVRRAAEVLAPHGVALRARIDEFTPDRCALVGRAARDELARFVDDGGAEVPILVVRRVQDLDTPDYDLMGVSWRARRAGGPPRRWIFLTERARPPVLAHELGHFLGLPHDLRGGTLMTPGPSDPSWRSARPPAPAQEILDGEQAARLRRGLAERLRARR